VLIVLVMMQVIYGRNKNLKTDVPEFFAHRNDLPYMLYYIPTKIESRILAGYYHFHGFHCDRRRNRMVYGSFVQDQESLVV
jgi:hypothetical protein